MQGRPYTARSRERTGNLMIDPKRAALIMIDMQNGFIDPASSLCVAGAAATVPACARALATARDAGMVVFHVRRAYAPDGSDVEPVRHRIWQEGGRPLCVEGDDPESLDAPDLLKPADGDRVMVKPRFSAFFDTPLADVLRRANHPQLHPLHLLRCAVAQLQRRHHRRLYVLAHARRAARQHRGHGVHRSACARLRDVLRAGACRHARHRRRGRRCGARLPRSALIRIRSRSRAARPPPARPRRASRRARSPAAHLQPRARPSAPAARPSSATNEKEAPCPSSASTTCPTRALTPTRA